jgi:uncharacterized membrane protein YkvA (DUF1232 family)
MAAGSAAWRRYRDLVGVAGTSAPTGGRAYRLLLHLPNLVRLFWRLLRDPRVSIWPKAMLCGALVYVVLPTDLLPDVVPLLGQVDDLVVVLVAARWFLGWCPAEIVREHVTAISGRRRT